MLKLLFFSLALAQGLFPLDITKEEVGDPPPRFLLVNELHLDNIFFLF